ncbi:hypothetical protein LSTR_LSTR009077 [Laodelphax striatellus]|uniref:Uncharacterized protein n=1 Tax=Laodelphax striatellus TaxID=195883 RepID=A0A482XJV0_LAOST|nr:hypothetical protein LSTR_LSTR016337 [Laodelphax striatellus]RZF47541.1 hypothetical protein LSTR_LSTR009077 [Laodelphax striatellus]
MSRCLSASLLRYDLVDQEGIAAQLCLRPRLSSSPPPPQSSRPCFLMHAKLNIASSRFLMKLGLSLSFS